MTFKANLTLFEVIMKFLFKKIQNLYIFIFKAEIKN